MPQDSSAADAGNDAEDADAAGRDADDRGDDATAAAPGDSLRRQLAVYPVRTVVVAGLAVLVVAYAVFLQAELFVAIWLLAVGFLVYLAWRLVRAHERLAAAAERLADRDG